MVRIPDYNLRTKINSIYNQKSAMRADLQREMEKSEEKFNLELAEELWNHLVLSDCRIAWQAV